MTPDPNGGEPTTPPDPNNPVVSITVTFTVPANAIGPERTDATVEAYAERLVRGGGWGQATIFAVDNWSVANAD